MLSLIKAQDQARVSRLLLLLVLGNYFICTHTSVGASYSDASISSIQREIILSKVQPPPAQTINEGQWRLPKKPDRPNIWNEANQLEAGKPKFGPLSAEKLRIDYQQTTGLYSSDLTSRRQIEDNSIQCKPGDYSCNFRDSCGSAPLNPLSGRKSTGYVVNGENQVYGEWPSFARLAIDLGPHMGTSFCGGTLVTDRHVLTAAHCVYKKRPINNRRYPPKTLHPKDIQVTLGEHDVSRRDAHEKKYHTKSICASKKYPVPQPSGQSHDDWAIIELTRPVKFNEHVQPACLPYEPINRKGKMAKCFLVGTGAIGFKFNQNTGRDHEQLTDIVQKLRVEQVSCRAWRLSDLDRSRECYSKVNRQEGDSCTGDSGGPVLCLNSKKRWTLVASVSYGTSKCNNEDKEAWVGVYSRLRTLLDDIKQQCNFS